MELLASTPTTLEELKEFLITVEEIFGGMTEQVESQSCDICERYRIIKLYGDEEFLQNVSLFHLFLFHFMKSPCAGQTRK